jgi:hypothetical protein
VTVTEKRERRLLFPVALGADTGMAVVGDIFAPTMAAIALGLVGRQRLAWRLGRNGAFDRDGANAGKPIR